jgi:tetratricopeptide (TPR) repeat protein
MAAQAFAAGGAKERASALWREILATTNAGPAECVAAAAGLGDVESLRKALAAAEGTSYAREAQLNLARRLVKDDGTFAEGAAMIKSAVKESPGADGAKDAYLALADATLARKEYEDAAALFKEATESWPETSRNAAVQEGIGWAMRRLGKTDAAVEAFGKCAEAASDDAAKAAAMLAQGDALAEAGRDEEALAKFREVVDKYPATPSGERLKTMLELREAERRGRELYAAFRFAEAAEVFASLAARDPSRKPRMDYLEMLCLYGQGLDAEAARKAKDLAAGSPDKAIKAEATLWLAKFFYNARCWDDSRDMFAEYATNMAPSSAWAPSALLWASRAAFAGNEFLMAVDLSTKLARDYPDAAEKICGYLVQGEALVELSRLDEAVVVLEKVVSDSKSPAGERVRAKTLKADALFAMGADNPARYREALADYRAIAMGGDIDADAKLSLAYKIARTLERLGRTDEAIGQYYAEVVCAYRSGRAAGQRYGDEGRATFARAAFRLADEYENRGDKAQADAMLKLVVRSDVGAAAEEARRRRERLRGKGLFK